MVLSSEYSIMSSIIQATASLADLSFLKPNWELLNICLFMNDTNCVAVSFTRPLTVLEIGSEGCMYLHVLTPCQLFYE
jgi:hypothetical protein